MLLSLMDSVKYNNFILTPSVSNSQSPNGSFPVISVLALTFIPTASSIFFINSESLPVKHESKSKFDKFVFVFNSFKKFIKSSFVALVCILSTKLKYFLLPCDTIPTFV